MQPRFALGQDPLDRLAFVDFFGELLAESIQLSVGFTHAPAENQSESQETGREHSQDPDRYREGCSDSACALGRELYTNAEDPKTGFPARNRRGFCRHTSGWQTASNQRFVIEHEGDRDTACHGCLDRRREEGGWIDDRDHRWNAVVPGDEEERSAVRPRQGKQGG